MTGISRERDLRILSIVQKCTGWLEQAPRRLQTEGIFRVSGSAKVCSHILSVHAHASAERLAGRKSQAGAILCTACAFLQSCCRGVFGRHSCASCAESVANLATDCLSVGICSGHCVTDRARRAWKRCWKSLNRKQQLERSLWISTLRSVPSPCEWPAGNADSRALLRE